MEEDTEGLISYLAVSLQEQLTKGKLQSGFTAIQMSLISQMIFLSLEFRIEWT